MAAINIQRGRDHGLPAYTEWREPCGLSPINNWHALEKVVGPNSLQRIKSGYRHVEDIDLFVGGLAERPVVGGLVGPTFACIIAQQFSNLRKGDRFWYENGGFQSSFTPAQLQFIRQVSFAQVVCNAIGGGTLQPHIFLPHTVRTNGRVLCGEGSLASIDLRAWLEKDPLGKVQRIKSPLKASNSITKNKIAKLPSNALINKAPKHRAHSSSSFPSLSQKRGGMTDESTDKIAPKQLKVNGNKHKRNVQENNKEHNARGAIHIKIHRPATNDKSNEQYKNDEDKFDAGKEYIILTPDHTGYDIEIEIKPNSNRKRDKIVTQQSTNKYFHAATVRPHNYISGAAQNHDEDRPFYNYPALGTDHSNYYDTRYAESMPYTQQNDRDPYKPHHTMSRPHIDDHKNKQPYSYRPAPTKNSFGYGSQALSDQSYGNRPIYLDEIETTTTPVRLTTTYNYVHKIKLQNPAQNGYHDIATNRPHDLMTFYTVMTTKKRKQSRPTHPISTIADDEETATWSPTAVISNIMNSFSDYFGTSQTTTTTTQKPYIEQYGHDDDFYMYPTFTQSSFPYSRQEDHTLAASFVRHVNRNTTIRKNHRLSGKLGNAGDNPLSNKQMERVESFGNMNITKKSLINNTTSPSNVENSNADHFHEKRTKHAMRYEEELLVPQKDSQESETSRGFVPLNVVTEPER